MKRDGQKKRRHFPKGRQVQEEALVEVVQLLADHPRRRDLLIEYLHLIQDRFGHLSAAHLAALAHELRLSMAEVQEVASFYAHFDLVREGEDPPPPKTVRVCDSLSCKMAGAQKLYEELSRSESPGDVRVVRAPCMGRCFEAPAVSIAQNGTTKQIGSAEVWNVDAALIGGEMEDRTKDAERLVAYRNSGGYSVLNNFRNGKLSVDALIAGLDTAGLRGMGGAGFPTHRKWQFVRAEKEPRYVVVNADEGEPGTFKDRYCFETRPHRVLEGALIAAYAVEAVKVFIYLRDEYADVRGLLLDEIAALEAAGLTPSDFIELRRGAGAYICGEESAMLESIEGKRGMPRHRPPFVAQQGVFGCPTLVNNVETLYWLPELLQDPRGFSEQGKNGASGLRLYSVSGRVNDPGVKCAPAGITLEELIDEHCGGMPDGHSLKGFLPGGASGGMMPAELSDRPLTFGSFEPFGGFIGSAAIIVLSNKDEIDMVLENVMRFFEDESCGQCTPCRLGCQKAVAMMQDDHWDVDQLKELADLMTDASICGLGQAAGNPIRTALASFADELPIRGDAS